MASSEISMEDKFAILHQLLSPVSGSEEQRPVVIALKPFDPDDVMEILALGSLGNEGITSTNTETGQQTTYLGMNGVNYLVREKGWKVVAILLVNGESYRGQVLHNLLTILVLPKS